MLLRLSLLLGLAASLACARSTSSAQVFPELALEPAFAWTPEGTPQWGDPSHEGDPVRDIVYTEPGELPRLEAAGAVLPLRNTDVRAHLRGELAEVVVTQRFVNDQAAPIEAIYTFPLPENSAVTDMRIVLGERVITAEIRERGQARQLYRDAAVAGHTAALLEQERPNVFTQSIANIPPGEAIDVEIRYLQTLSYDAGEYEFVFPTVVGPRYLPGQALAPAHPGTRPDTDRVPDASRISPPILGQGLRTGNDLSIEVIAEAGAPITAWAAPAHAVTALAAGPRLHVRLARRDEIPNRDFVLRYRSADLRPRARLFLGPTDAGGGHFLLIAEPPRLDVDALVGRRELLFVVDVSGSMQGPPLALAKATLREALAGARPVDTFDVVTFAGETRRLFGAPHPVNAETLRRADAFIDGLSAGGGTEMAAAVDTALRDPVADGRHRYVFLLTDGYIGEEAAIASSAHALVEAQRRAGRRARVFGVGIGEAPNSHLIAAISSAGQGIPLHVRQPLDLPRAAQAFRRTIDAPVITDLAVEWGSLAVDAVSPAHSPDLFASRPLVIHGRYSGAAPRELRLRGRVGERSVTIPIEVAPAQEPGPVLARLWARDRVGDLELALATATAADAQQWARDEILALGLRHHLVTPYTSLVAVDRSRRVEGSALRIVQPVELPAGVDPVMAGAISLQPTSTIPVGGTSRDFTAVVDISPTATRDAAGIRLGGTTAAESRHVVDAQTITAPAFGSVGATIVPEFPEQLPGGFVTVEPHARARVREVRAGTADERHALRDLLRAQAEPLAQCFTAGERKHHRVHRNLVLVVRRGSDGALAGFEVRTRHELGDAITACLRAHIGRHLHALRPGRSAEIDLGVWMRF